MRDAVNEPLSAQIAGVRRPARASRALVIVRLTLVAAAVAALVVAASRSHPKAPDATDLALPMLLAVAVGLLCGLLVLVVSGAVGPVVVASAARCRRTSPPGPCDDAARARW